MIKYVRSHLVPLIFLHVVLGIIVWLNFPAGKWFIGWDSLHPEFNFGLNLVRGLSAAWQGNYGVGTLTGHGFAATIPHTLITWLLSLFVGIQAVRPAFALLCFYLGGIGMYVFSILLLRKLLHDSPLTSLLERPNVTKLIAIATALFYLVNLATIQQFYLELEAFIVQFASLPWLFTSVLLLTDRVSLKRIVFFVAVNLFASIQGFIPALFIVYFVMLVLFLTPFALGRPRGHNLKRAVLLLFLTLCVNAYWLGPFGYYTLSHGASTGEAYNNLMQTPEFVEKSHKYGDLHNIALLKGFYWDTFELGEDSYGPWRDHHRQLPIVLIGYLFFSVVLTGLIGSLFLIRNWLIKGASLVFVFLFSNLALDTFPFSLLVGALYQLSDTYYQVFRTTFTKFSLGLGFIYSLFFVLGILIILHLLKRSLNKRVLLAVPTGVIVLSFIYGIPLFQGELFYKKLLIDLPKPYQEVMEYFKTQPDGRIADFPQDCPEGWYGYKWGYFGSGFYWYGVKQPFMSRVFDIWSTGNESYYWELTQALRNKNYPHVDAILDKYDVKWVLYDPNFIHCRNQQSFLTTLEYIDYLKSHPGFYQVAEFQSETTLPITLYERNETAGLLRTTDNIDVDTKLPINDKDPIFESTGVYVKGNDPVLAYPFTELFTKRASQTNGALIKSEAQVTFSTKLNTHFSGKTLQVPSLIETESFIPISLSLVPEGTEAGVYLKYELPKISLNGNQLTPPIPAYKIGDIPDSAVEIYVNQEPIQPKDDTYHAVLTLKTQNEIQITNTQRQDLLKWQDDQIFQSVTKQNQSLTLPTFADGNLEVAVPMREGSLFGSTQYINQQLLPRPCGETTPSDRNKYEFSVDPAPFVKLISLDSKQCLDFVFNNTSTSLAYLVEVEHRHHQGNSLRVSITNKNRPTGIDVLLRNSANYIKETMILPPTFPNETGYVVTFLNNSFTTVPTVNDVKSVRFMAFPYTFLTSLRIGDETRPIVQTPIRVVNHPFDTFYKANLNTNDSLLYLSQGFDPGWIALAKTNQFPYVTKLDEHVLVNNWANGWILTPESASGTIYLFFWPQLLEWFGFILLLVPIGLIVKHKKAKHVD